MALKKQPLSHSTDFRAIPITSIAPGVAGAGTNPIHDGQTGMTNSDEVILYVKNNDTVNRKIYLYVGGFTDPDDLTVVSVPALSGWMRLLPGYPIWNSLPIAAYGEVANKLAIYGYINKES